MNITETGQSHLIVIQETVTLDDGWEIGVFDLQAVINDNNCETEYGELLVASGIWEGNQLNFSSIGSINFCHVGGEQRAGYIEDNEIIIRVYNPYELIEYTTTYSTFSGLNPSFISGFVTAISAISIVDIYAYNSISSQIYIEDFLLKKIYPNPANPFLNIDYEISKKGEINFSIFGVNGEKIKELNSQNKNLGHNSQYLDLTNFSTGIYFLRMNFLENNTTQKFIVLK